MLSARLFLNEQTVSQIVEHLENIRSHPLIVFGSISISATEQFLNGFNDSLRLFGLSREIDAYSDAVNERGWESLSARPWREMQERGLSERAIVDELLALESEAWRRTLQRALAPG